MISPFATSSRRRGRSSPRLRLQENIPLAIVVMMVVLVPLLPGPSATTPWDGASGVTLGIGGILLLAVAVARADRSGLPGALAFARRGPTPWLLALVAWGLLSGALRPGVAAVQGLFTLASGVLVYLTVASQTRRRDHYRLLLDALITATVVMSLLGIGSQVLTGRMAAGALFSHRGVGAFLMLMLPALLPMALDSADSPRRTAAQAACGLAAVGLLLARWAPALRGEAVALLVLGLIGWRLGLLPRLDQIREASARRNSRPRRHGSRRRGSRSGHSSRRGDTDTQVQAIQYVLYGVALLFAVGLFLTMTHTNAVVLRRVRPALMAAAAVPQHLWRGAASITTGEHSADSPGGKRNTRAVLAMIQARPLLGWGIGSYPVYQSRFTHEGDDAAAVRRTGPQPMDRARNVYLQTAAELGLPGLVLWVGALALFFVTGIRALRAPSENPLRPRLLAGCLAAVAGQAVSALSDSSWQYSGLSLSLWLLLGLGMAAAGLGESLSDGAAQAGDAPAVARPATGAPLRFAAACVLTAVLLSQVMRLVR